MTDLFSNYGVPNDIAYDIGLFNKLSDMNNLTSELQNKTLNFKTNTGFLDTISFYMTNAMNSMKLGFQSFGFFVSLTNAAFSSNYLSFAGSSYLQTTLILSTLTALIIGVLVSAIMKFNV
jgi:hypothetical protein